MKQEAHVPSFFTHLASMTFFSLVASLITLGILSFIFLRTSPDVVSRFGFFLFFAILSFALIIPASMHVRSYHAFPCMTGMMIGMTIGMIAGVLSGFYVGATNGMFYGSVTGILIGIGFGVWNGNCCGVMGIMEGIMAGFMGGLMGGMTALMLLNDHLMAMSILVFCISLAIIGGLHYLILHEGPRLERRTHKGTWHIILLSILLTLLTFLMIVFGPRGGVFA